MKINPKSPITGNSSKPNWRKPKIEYEFDSNINIRQLDGSNQIYLGALRELDTVTSRDEVSCRCVEERTSEMVTNCINHIIKKQDDMLMRTDMEVQEKQFNKGKL
jgi:hypothetical protein